MKTITRYLKIGSSLEPVIERGGDDTVPAASAASMPEPTSYVKGSHGRIFKVKALREILYPMLGAPPGIRPVSATGAEVGEAVIEDIVPPDEPVAAGAPFEVLVNFRIPQDNFRDQIQLSPTAAIRLTAPHAPGFYELKFAVSESDDPTPPVLTVGFAE